MATIRARKCVDCERTYDLLIHTDGDEFGLDHPDGLSVCPDCGSDEKIKLISVGVAIETGGDHGVGRRFPYFDRGLGCQVRSKQHHKWLMKHHPDGTPRESELIPVEGDYDIERAVRHRRERVEAARARLKAADDEFKASPDYGAYATWVERGGLKEHVERTSSRNQKE